MAKPDRTALQTAIDSLFLAHSTVPYYSQPEIGGTQTEDDVRSDMRERSSISTLDDIFHIVGASGIPSRVVNKIGLHEFAMFPPQSFTVGEGLTSEVVMHALDGEVDGFTGRKTTRTLVALKMFKPASPGLGEPHEETRKRRKALYAHIAREIKIYSHPLLSNHPNLVQILFIGWKADHAYPMLATELGSYGSLDHVIKMPGDTPTTLQKQHITLDIALGLEAIHNAGFVHGDIKPDNIIVCRFADPKRDVIAKLGDFGGSVEIQAGKPVHFTPLWCAPELVIRFSEDALDWKKADIYSYGLVISSLWAKYSDRGGFGAGRHPSPTSCFLTSFVPHPDTKGIGADIITLMKCDLAFNRVLSAVSDRVDVVEPEAKPVLMDLLTPILQTDPQNRPDRLSDVLVDIAKISERNLIQEAPDLGQTSNSLGYIRKPGSGSRLWPSFAINSAELKNTIVGLCEYAIEHIYLPRKVSDTSLIVGSDESDEHPYTAPEQVPDIPAVPESPYEPVDFLRLVLRSTLQLHESFKKLLRNRDDIVDYWTSAKLAQYMGALRLEAIGSKTDSDTQAQKWIQIAATCGTPESTYLAPFLSLGGTLETRFPIRLYLCLLALSGSHAALQSLDENWPDCSVMIRNVMRSYSTAFQRASTSHPGILFSETYETYLQYEQLPAEERKMEQSLSLRDALIIGAKNDIEYSIESMPQADFKDLLCQIAQSRLSDSDATSLAEFLVEKGAELKIVTQRLLPGTPTEFYGVSATSKGSALEWAMVYGKKQLALRLFCLHVEHGVPIPEFTKTLGISAYFLYHELMEVMLLLQQDSPDLCSDSPRGGEIGIQRLIDPLLRVADSTNNLLDVVVQQKIKHGQAWRTARKSTMQVLMAWSAELSLITVLQGDDVDGLALLIQKREETDADLSSFFRDPRPRKTTPAEEHLLRSAPPVWWISMICDAQHCFEFLLQHYPGFTEAPSSYNDESPLHVACKCKNIFYAKALLEAGCDWEVLDARGATPLVTALLATNIETATLIEIKSQYQNLERLAGFQAGQSLIWFQWLASRDRGLIESLRWIRDHNGLKVCLQVDQDIGLGESRVVPAWNFILGPPRPIQELDQQSDLEMMQILLRDHDFLSQINTVRFRGKLLLHAAVRGGHIKIVQMLLNEKSLQVDINAPISPETFPNSYFPSLPLTAFDLAQFTASEPEPPGIASGGLLEVQSWHKDMENILELFRDKGARSLIMDSLPSLQSYLRSTHAFSEAALAGMSALPLEMYQRLAAHNPFKSERPKIPHELRGKWPQNLPESNPTNKDAATPLLGQNIDHATLVQDIMDKFKPFIEQATARHVSGEQYERTAEDEEFRSGDASYQFFRTGMRSRAEDSRDEESQLSSQWWQEEYFDTIRCFVREMKGSKPAKGHEGKGKGKEVLTVNCQSDPLSQRLQETSSGGLNSVIKRLIEQSALINDAVPDSSTPLRLAIIRDEDGMTLLFQEGEDETPLHQSTESGCTLTEQTLMGKDVDLLGNPKVAVTSLQSASAAASSDTVVKCIPEASGSSKDMEPNKEIPKEFEGIAQGMIDNLNRDWLRMRIIGLMEERPDVCPVKVFNYDNILRYATDAEKRDSISLKLGLLRGMTAAHN